MNVIPPLLGWNVKNELFGTNWSRKLKPPKILSNSFTFTTSTPKVF
jgi:hypothetical protein